MIAQHIAKETGAVVHKHMNVDDYADNTNGEGPPVSLQLPYTTMAPLPPLPAIAPQLSEPSQPLVEPPDARTLRARLQRDGIGAKGTFNPLPVVV